MTIVSDVLTHVPLKQFLDEHKLTVSVINDGFYTGVSFEARLVGCDIDSWTQSVPVAFGENKESAIKRLVETLRGQTIRKFRPWWFAKSIDVPKGLVY